MESLPSSGSEIKKNFDIDDFDVDAIINCRGMISIVEQLYLVYTNEKLREMLEIERTKSEKPVTALFKMRWYQIKQKPISLKMSHINFLYLTNENDENEIYVHFVA